uniref:C2H2-type domain-containing protein n=1 Tax=Globisporangium ultimum (strain ATCC 200006 / CBS 805.95 / DAOM BR144) TaxID=431595 RepID=K3X323_GLOUD
MSFYNTAAYAGGLPPTSTTGAASTASNTSSSSSGYQPPHKRQRVSDDSNNGATKIASAASPSEAEANGESSSDKNANNAGTYPNMALSLQKDQSWGMLGDVDSFGGLGPMPSMNAVLEKRASSQFSISSLLPSSSTMGLQHSTSTTTTTTVTNELSANNGQQPQYADGSGGNQKYMDATTGEYMYPDNVRPMTFVDKQSLVQKITLLPSQYLRGLMDVISKYQPETVRQIDDDGYAFDLGQMNENTVWAISDYVKDSMVELDGYIRSLSSVGIADGQNAAGADSVTSSQTGLGRHQSSNELLNNPKMAGVAQNESQTKFLEQVDMYSKPKITKSRVKPSKKHECETCKKQFRGRSELQNHIRTHTKEKPLACSHAGCNKRYAHSSNLRAHERTHLGIKPYSCHYDGCGKSFAHSVSLKEHIWMHAGFQPYVCPYEGCEKKFTQVSNFARHKKTHEKEARSENDHSIESDN